MQSSLNSNLLQSPLGGSLLSQEAPGATQSPVRNSERAGSSPETDRSAEREAVSLPIEQTIERARSLRAMRYSYSAIAEMLLDEGHGPYSSAAVNSWARNVEQLPEEQARLDRELQEAFAAERMRERMEKSAEQDDSSQELKRMRALQRCSLDAHQIAAVMKLDFPGFDLDGRAVKHALFLDRMDVRRQRNATRKRARHLEEEWHLRNSLLGEAV